MATKYTIALSEKAYDYCIDRVFTALNGIKISNNPNLSAGFCGLCLNVDPAFRGKIHCIKNIPFRGRQEYERDVQNISTALLELEVTAHTEPIDVLQNKIRALDEKQINMLIGLVTGMTGGN